MTSRYLIPALLIQTAASAFADNFGSVANSFSIQFVTIGNAGNADDAGAGGGIYSTPYGGTSYSYRMGVTEVPTHMVTKAVNLGLNGIVHAPWAAEGPATFVSWYEAAAFVNWLNESTEHQRAYDLGYSGGWLMNLWDSGDAWQFGGENRFRHRKALYFLPSEDEWYKAACHQNDGATANYYDYATGSNVIPDGIDFAGDPAFDAVFQQPYSASAPNVTNVGRPSPYGTYGQNGNVVEWMESAADGLNDSAAENRAFRDGPWNNGFGEFFLRSSQRGGNVPGTEGNGVGFRVASVIIPEPASLSLSSAASAFAALGAGDGGERKGRNQPASRARRHAAMMAAHHF